MFLEFRDEAGQIRLHMICDMKANILQFRYGENIRTLARQTVDLHSPTESARELPLHAVIR